MDRVDSKELITLARQNIIPLGIGLVGFVFLLVGFAQVFSSNSHEPAVVFNDSDSTKSKLIIDVEGAVMAPGVYTLSSTSRTVDALAAAGGLSYEADRDWVEKNINLASRVSDGLKIYIPRVGEDILSGESIDQAGTGGPVMNINNASLQDLEGLPGIGEVTAQKIIDSRPYLSIDDLLTKKIVGSATYEKIKNQISAN